MKILFLLKRNLLSGGKSSAIAKSGLLNSATITAGQLHKHLGLRTELEVCVDANEIDKFLHKHKPKVCIIEAIWVTPAKMYELANLHKKIKFVVLVHSEVPFLANEGNAIDWIKQYNEIPNVFPAFNSFKTFEQFLALQVGGVYLPNIYLDVDKKQRSKRNKYDDHIDIGCFGAVRPFKNQCLQVVSAIVFADRSELKLRFHMNTSRTEQGGDSVLKNIRALFEGTPHKLIEHGWLNREPFMELVANMDLGLQISMTESFNICAANFVEENVPLVVSPTIDWMPQSQQASTEDMEDIIAHMEYSIINRRNVVEKSLRHLNRYNKRALEAWQNFINTI